MKLVVLILSFGILLIVKGHRIKNHQFQEKYDFNGKSHFHKDDLIEKATVKLSAGRVQGYVVSPTPEDSNLVNVFKGVPLAVPPIGEKRYALPQSVEEWKGVWNATYYRPACPSNTSQTTSPQKTINEDCLYVNVFADQTCEKTKCPVLFIIHGGAFHYDSAVMFNDTYLIENYASKGIVVVIPAYRLGIFGFADLGSDDIIPRNLGLYDIVHALNWVQNEIEAFGGDSKQVTLFGNSAGGSVITYLSIAQDVKKLWSRAVISSPASPLWKNANFDVTAAIIEKAGCLNNGSYDLPHPPAVQVACLNKLNFTELVNAQRAVDDAGLRFDGLSIDSHFFKGKGFIDSLKDYKSVPTLLGSSKWEFEIELHNVAHYCYDFTRLLDYSTDAVLDECNSHYSEDIYPDGNQNPLTRDGLRALLFRIASVITNSKNKAYVYSFELEGHNNHAGELTFAIGLHPIKGVPNWKEALMTEYFPKVIRKFITNDNVENALIPFEHGRNYEVFDFSNSSGTLRGPSPILQKYFPEALSYWFGDLGKMEKEAKAIEEKNRTDSIREKWAEISEKEREEKWQRFREAFKNAQKAANISETRKQKSRAAKEEQFLDYLLSDSLTEVANGLKKIIKVEKQAGDDTSNVEAILEKIEGLIDGIKAEEENVSTKWHEEKKNHGYGKSSQKRHQSEHQNDEKEKKSQHNDKHDDNETPSGIGRGDPSNPKHVSDLMKQLHDAQRKKALEEASKNATAEAVKPKLQKVNETKAQLDEDIKNVKEAGRQSQAEQIKKLHDAKKEIDQKKSETKDAIADDLQKAADKINATKNDRIQKANSTAEKINEAKSDSVKDDKNTKADIAKTVNETRIDIGNKLNSTNNDVNDKLDETVNNVRGKRDIDVDNKEKFVELWNNTRKSVYDKILEGTKLKNETAVELSKKWNTTLADLETKRREAIEKWKQQVGEIDGDDEAGEKYSFEKEVARINVTTELKETLKHLRSEAKNAFEQEIKETADTYSEAVQKLRNETREIVFKALEDFKKLKNETLNNLKTNVFASQTELFSLPVLDNIFGNGVAPAGRMSEDAREAWSAFWIVATIAAMLAAALLIMAIMSWFKARGQPKGGYYYNEDPGYFTEKSRIILAARVPKYSDL